MAEDEKKETRFSESDQAMIQEIIDKRHAKWRERSAEELESKLKEQREEHEKALAERDATIAKLQEQGSGKEGTGEGGFTAEDVERIVKEKLEPVLEKHEKELGKLQDQLGAATARGQTLEGTIIRKEVENASRKAKVRDTLADVVPDLPELRGRIRVNESGGTYVVSEDGQPLTTLNVEKRQEEPVSVDAYVSGILEKRPDFIQGNYTPGSGSPGSPGGTGVGGPKTPGQLVSEGIQQRMTGAPKQ